MSMAFGKDDQKDLQTPLMRSSSYNHGVDNDDANEEVTHGQTNNATGSSTVVETETPAIVPLSSLTINNDTNNSNNNDHYHSTSRFLDRNAAFYQSRGHWGVQRQLRGTRLRGTRPTNSTTATNRISPTTNTMLSSDGGGSSRQHGGGESGSSTSSRSIGTPIHQQLQRSRVSSVSGDYNNCTIQLRSALSYVWGDWFHSLAYRPTLQLVAIIFLTYGMLVFIFAYIYLGVSKLGTKITTDGGTTDSFCRMDIENHMDALYFSLSTMTTIGYGASDYYFADCWTPLLLVLLQTCCCITFQSIAIGLLFQRISRGQKRSRTIVFSNMAVIRMVKGTPHLMIRIGELRRQHLIQIHVRCYCIKHERYAVGQNRNNTNNSECDMTRNTPAQTQHQSQPQQIETAYFMTRHLKLHYPDESLGSQILMSVPQVIVHCLDDSSPLVPKHKHAWYDRQGQVHEYCQASNDTTTTVMESLSMYVQDREVEIIVQVEGVDELTGQALQARQSYRWNDLAWGYTFAPCITQPMPHDHNENSNRLSSSSSWWWSKYSCQRQQREHPVCLVDFGQFHNIIPITNNDDEDECPYVSS